MSNNRWANQTAIYKYLLQSEICVIFRISGLTIVWSLELTIYYNCYWCSGGMCYDLRPGCPLRSGKNELLKSFTDYTDINCLSYVFWQQSG